MHTFKENIYQVRTVRPLRLDSPRWNREGCRAQSFSQTACPPRLDGLASKVGQSDCYQRVPHHKSSTADGPTPKAEQSAATQRASNSSEVSTIE
jgi:hypothetical protein